MVRNYPRNKSAVTLIELVITLVVLAVIGATIVGVVIFAAQLFIYSPRQLDTQKIAQELNNLILDGDQNVRGIRYARFIIDASAAQFSYTYGYPAATDGQSVRFRWDSGDKHIYRSTSSDGGAAWSAETVVPYYISSADTIDGKDTSGVIFTYKKANDAVWVSGVDPLTDIRRVIISIKLKTGSGNFNDMQGYTAITASAEIKGF